MVERAQDLVKIHVSGLVFRSCLRDTFHTIFLVIKSQLSSVSKREADIAVESINLGPAILEKTSAVATLTLDRPNTGNQIDGEMADALGEACRLVAEDDQLRLLVLTANGDSFSIDGGSTNKWEGVPGNPAAHIAALAVPVLVALNGDATGPGLELALAGDLRICVPTAQFGFPGLSQGVLPQDGGTQRLPRLVGPAWARDMLLTGRIVTANDALSIGLVNRVTEGPGQLADSVAELVAQIAGGSPLGARYAKEAVGKGMDLSLDQGLGLEADLNVILQSTADRAEGIKSFLENRGSEFKGS